MVRSDENNPGVIEPTNAQGDLRAGGGKISSGVGQNRTALSNIDPNIIGGPPYPSEVNKRGPPEKNGISDKDLPILVHRPVTRKFAAQMANKRRVIAETSSSTSRSEDRSITDVEDYHAGVEDPVPMFVQHTQALLDEIDHQMVEVEMEDIADEELLVDIDSSDKDNQLAVVEYIDDLYAYYRKSESSSCVPPNYMANQFDINERMRGILIDRLIEVHYKFELMEETLYLTVNLVDRFLAVKPVMRKKLQLVGVTAMLLACKYEEVSVPVVEDLILISDKAYSRKEVLDMEKSMVNALQFNLSVPTPYVFMRRFLKAAQYDEELELLSFFMIELCLVEYEMLKFPPSQLAAAAIFTAQSALIGSKQWNKTTEWHSTYSEEQLL